MHFRHPWYSVIHHLEQALGRFAFPGLIRAIAIFQFLVVVLMSMLPEYHRLLVFDLDKILSGQVWRLFTFIFIPRSVGLIWGLITMMLLWFANDVLEQRWGPFQVTLYVVSSMGLLLAALFIVPPGVQAMISYFGGTFLYTAVFVAAAAVVPDHELRLFFVIPVKMKWLGLVVLAFALFRVFELAEYNLEGFGLLALGAALTPYMLVFIPKFAFEFKHRQKVAIRKARFQSAQVSEDEAFHKCAKCGKTEQDDPDAEFRIEDDDEEYCLECLGNGVQTQQ